MMSLENAAAFLKLQSPKELVQQLATADEAIRRSRLRGGGEAKGSLAAALDEFRGLMEPKKGAHNGAS